MRNKLAIILAALGLMLVGGAATANASDTCPAFNLNQSAVSDPTCDLVPHFKASFINRVWSFDGAVDEVDLEGHTLDMTTSAIENLPAKFASQDDPILDQDTHVLFKPGTKVFGPEGTAVSQDYLDYADSIVVRGKLLPPSKWDVNADGITVPTIRAKRLYITSYVDDGSTPPSDPSTDPTPAPVTDPTPADGVITTVDVTIWIELHITVHH
jgi:hypothetical protein